MYHSLSSETARDLWVLPMTGDPVPFVFLQTPFQEFGGIFSPDGRWVTYQSNESGRNEVYVRAFMNPDDRTAAAPDGQWQISTTGGIDPTWSPDGSELYYLDSVGNMMAVPIITTRETFEAGEPVVLFNRRIFGAVGRQYDVAPDGRFLINSLVDDVANDPITLILNWNPEAAN